jgi:hypothetical protein
LHRYGEVTAALALEEAGEEKKKNRTGADDVGVGEGAGGGDGGEAAPPPL